MEIEASIVHYCNSTFAQPSIAASKPFSWTASENSFTFRTVVVTAFLVSRGNVTSLLGDMRLPQVALVEG